MFITQLTSVPLRLLVFLFNDPAATDIYSLSLHDPPPIFFGCFSRLQKREQTPLTWRTPLHSRRAHKISTLRATPSRSEDHTSELQSQSNLVCRLLLSKKTQPPAAGLQTHRRSLSRRSPRH